MLLILEDSCMLVEYLHICFTDPYYDFLLHVVKMLSRPEQDFINTTTVLVAVLLILLGLYMWQISDRHNYPPGPLPLPYIGWAHRLLITNNPFKEINGKQVK